MDVRTFDPMVVVTPPVRGCVWPKLRSAFERCVGTNGEPWVTLWVAPELLDLVVNAPMPVPSEWERRSPSHAYGGRGSGKNFVYLFQ